MNTYIFERPTAEKCSCGKMDSLVSCFITEWDHETAMVREFTNTIQFGVGHANIIEFNQYLSPAEFAKMIKQDGWKLKEVVRH